MLKTKDVQKHASLTNPEREELVYYLREATCRNMEANMWNERAGVVERKIIARLAVDPNKYDIDWSKSVDEGKITYKPKEQNVETTKEKVS